MSTQMNRNPESQLAELEHLYQKAPVGLCLMDRELRYVRINECLAAYHGLPMNDHIGRTLHEIVPEIARQVEELIHGIFASGESVLNREVSAPSPLKPGPDRHWISSYYPYRSDSGEIIGVGIAVQEITALRQAEKELRESERRYTLAAAAGSVGVWEWEFESNEVYVDPLLKQMLGYREDEISADFDEWQEHVHPDDVERVLAAADAHIDGQSPRFEVEHRMFHKDRSIRWFLARGTVVKDAEGAPQSMLGSHTCITDRKRAEEEIAENRKQLDLQVQVLAKVHDAVTSVDMNGVIQTWNQGAERVYGYSAAEAIGENIRLLQFPEDREKIGEKVLKPLLSDGFKEVEGRRRTKAGDEITVHLNLSLLRDHNGEPVGIIGCSNDITEKRSLQEELLRVAGREQRRIGQELHDTIGQELVGLGLLAHSLRNSLEGSSPERVEILAKVQDGIERSLERVRAISRGLVPYDIDGENLGNALSDLAGRASDLGEAECCFSCDSNLGPDLLGPLEDKGAARHLYQIAQESVTNALKHSSAAHIQMHLGRDNGTLRLEVADDGVGCSTESIMKGAGHRIMALRAELIGADLEIKASPEGGTTVSCLVGLE